jgi:TrmH family RNA methyltransferase
MKSISSSANPGYRLWAKLASMPRAVREHRLTLAEGLHLAEAAIAAGVSIEAVLLRRGARGAALDALLAQLAAAQFELTAELYDQLALAEHGAGLALLLRLPAEDPGVPDTDALYLDGVQDPGNAGALLRTAAAAGLRRVLAGPSTAALWAPKALRAGQGAHFRLRLAEAVAPGALASHLHGPWIATVVRDAPSLWHAELPAGPVGWVVGAEGQGVGAAALAGCALRVRIPVDSAVESLNVAAAAAVCLFERRRRADLATLPA